MDTKNTYAIYKNILRMITHARNGYIESSGGISAFVQRKELRKVDPNPDPLAEIEVSNGLHTNEFIHITGWQRREVDFNGFPRKDAKYTPISVFLIVPGSEYAVKKPQFELLVNLAEKYHGAEVRMEDKRGGADDAEEHDDDSDDVSNSDDRDGDEVRDKKGNDNGDDTEIVHSHDLIDMFGSTKKYGLTYIDGELSDLEIIMVVYDKESADFTTVTSHIRNYIATSPHCIRYVKYDKFQFYHPDSQEQYPLGFDTTRYDSDHTVTESVTEKDMEKNEGFAMETPIRCARTLLKKDVPYFRKKLVYIVPDTLHRMETTDIMALYVGARPEDYVLTYGGSMTAILKDDAFLVVPEY